MGMPSYMRNKNAFRPRQLGVKDETALITPLQRIMILLLTAVAIQTLTPRQTMPKASPDARE